MEDFYGRVVVRDVLRIQKIRGGCTQMVIEVEVDVFRELKTRKLKLEKWQLKQTENLRLKVKGIEFI